MVVTMNLGLVWTVTAIAIPMAAFVAVGVIASAVFFCFPNHISLVRRRFVIAVLFITGIGALLHGTIFNKLHQSINQYVPSTECKLYVASFGELRAIYSMQTKDQFLAWCIGDPPDLHEVSIEEIESYIFAIKADQSLLNFAHFDSFATSRFGAYRAYFVESEARVYLLYNAF